MCGITETDAMDCWGYDPPALLDSPAQELAVAAKMPCIVGIDGRVQCTYRDGAPAENELHALAVSKRDPVDPFVSVIGCGSEPMRASICWGNDDAGILEPPARALSRRSRPDISMHVRSARKRRCTVGAISTPGATRSRQHPPVCSVPSLPGTVSSHAFATRAQSCAGAKTAPGRRRRPSGPDSSR